MMRIFSLTFLLVFHFFCAYAQSVVTVIPSVRPPYSTLLSEYYSGDQERLSVMLINTDASQPFLQGYLRVTVEGQGVKLQSSPYGNYPAIDLMNGAPVTVSQSDLAPYFRPENLIGSTGAGQNRLPEGFYNFCFEVFEKNTHRILSTKQCAQAYLQLNDPAFLILPEKGKALSYTNPFNLVFQWTPRHLNLINTEYDFTLVEIWDTTITPEAAFFTAQPIYTTTTNSPNLFYGPGEPQLLMNKKYAWRVRTKVTTSNNEQEPFKNDGNSEIFWFKLQGECPALQKAVLVSDPRTNKTTLSWTPDLQHQGSTKLEYRKKGARLWTTIDAPNHQATLNGLSWNTDYEYQLGSRCVITNDFTYGSLQTFKTLAQDTANCVPSGPPVISNHEPIAMLRSNDTIYVSGFRMRLTQVSGSNGQFSGEGYLAFMVPTTTTEVSVKAAFQNISVNIDKNVFAGKIVSLYDKNEGGIGNLDPVTEGGINVGDVKTGVTNIDATVSTTIDPTVSATINITGTGNDTTYTVTIKGIDGRPVTLPPVKKLPITVQDDKGDIYSIDKTGKITPVGKASAALLAGKTTDDLNRLNSDKGKVTFENHADQVYALDVHQSAYNKSMLFSKEYESLNNAEYRVANKLLISNSTDKIIARINNLNRDLVEDSIHFITGKGIELLATKTGSKTYEITLLSGPAGDAQELYAIYRDWKAEKANTNASLTSADFTYSLGKLKIATYEAKQFKVILVPVGSAQIDKAKVSETLNRVYNKIGVRWTVEKDERPVRLEGWDNGDSRLDIKDAGKNNKYSEEMQKLNAYYASTVTIEATTPYLFVFDQPAINGINGEIDGDMLRNRQFGYLFSTSAETTKSAAHELGHGLFHLNHTFDTQYHLEKNDLPQNLMDYGTGSELAKLQWDAVHAPGMVFGIFEREGDAALIHGIWLTPDWVPFKYDPSDIVCNGLKYVQGTVSGIRSGQCYSATFGEYDAFKGYINSNGAPLPIEEILTLEKTTKIYVYQHNGGCPDDKYYSTTWEYIKSMEGKVLNFSNSNFTLIGDVKCNGVREASVEIRKTPCKDLPSNQDLITVDYLINNFFASQKPVCFSGINITVRKRLIKEMLQNWIVTECTQSIDLPSLPIGNCYEPLVYNLILSTSDAEGKIILDYLKSEKILDDLLNKTQFSTFDRVSNKLSDWILKYYPRPSSANEAITKALEKKLMVIDYIDNKVSGSIDGESITLKREVVGPMMYTGDYIPEISFPIDAYAYVIVVFKDNVGPFKKGDKKVMPAMQAYYLFNKDRREFIISSSQLILDIALLGLGVGEIEIAYTAYRRVNGIYAFYIATKGLADVGMSLADFTVNNALAEEWNKTEEGKKRLDRWNTISIAYMAGTLSLTGLESAVAKYGQNGRTISNAKQFDDVCDEIIGVVSETGALSNYAGKATKGVRNLLVLESPTGLFRQLKSTDGKTYRAATFWTDESADIMHYISQDSKYYIKHDPTNGRVLFVDVENSKFVGFLLDQDNLIGSNYEMLLNNLKTINGLPGAARSINVGQSVISFSDVQANLVLGKYSPNSVPGISNEIGTDDVIAKLGVLKNYSFADNIFELRGGTVHILNIPDGMYSPLTFFDTYNKGILDLAVNNKSLVKVLLVSDPRKANLLKTRNPSTGLLESVPSGFAMEIKYLREKGIKDVFLKDDTSLNLDTINLDNLDWSQWKY